MRIGCIGPDTDSTRVRFGQFAEQFARAGCETRELRWWPSSTRDVLSLTTKAIRLARWADVLVLVKPRMPPSVITALARINGHLIVDADDTIWEWNPEIARRYRHALAHAQHAVVGSEVLVGATRAMAPSLRIDCIRPIVDVRAYGLRRPPKTARVVVGWIGGPLSLDDFTNETLEGFADVIDGDTVEMRVVCSEPFVREQLKSVFVPWTLATEAAEVDAFDIGVMPLRDDAISRGRCGLKAIQYMAAGLPVVASPVGVAVELVEPGVTGFLADTAAEWADALAELTGSEDLRRSMGEQARARALREFDRGPASQRLLSIFEAARRESR